MSRTAVLKGLPRRQVMLGHALRNAMIAPFTVLLLQINWLIGGVVVTELVFAFPGFGRMLLEASLFGDVSLIEASTLVALFIATADAIAQRCRLPPARPAGAALMPMAAIDVRETAGRPTPGLLRRLPSSPVAMVGLAIVLFWVAVALLAPVLPLPAPNAQDYLAMGHSGSSAKHWLGVDPLARDLLSRIVWGARTVLAVAPIAVVAAYMVGCAMGLLAGYYRGWVDIAISRASDVILSFPVIVLYVDSDRQYRPVGAEHRRRRGAGLRPRHLAHRARPGAVADPSGLRRRRLPAARE